MYFDFPLPLGSPPSNRTRKEINNHLSRIERIVQKGGFRDFGRDHIKELEEEWQAVMDWEDDKEPPLYIPGQSDIWD